MSCRLRQEVSGIFRSFFTKTGAFRPLTLRSTRDSAQNNTVAPIQIRDDSDIRQASGVEQGRHVLGLCRPDFNQQAPARHQEIRCTRRDPAIGVQPVAFIRQSHARFMLAHIGKICARNHTQSADKSGANEKSEPSITRTTVLPMLKRPSSAPRSMGIGQRRSRIDSG